MHIFKLSIRSMYASAYSMIARFPVSEYRTLTFW